jgi:hypothetical protein
MQTNELWLELNLNPSCQIGNWVQCCNHIEWIQPLTEHLQNPKPVERIISNEAANAAKKATQVPRDKKCTLIAKRSPVVRFLAKKTLPNAPLLIGLMISKSSMLVLSL